MHVGAVMIFEGPPPGYDDFVNQVRSRLHLVPRYRQKLAFPPIETGRPVWIDDPSFNLEYHIRHTALPSPGSEEQLRSLAARIHSQQLDRAKPLWETWLVQGLEGNRFALISKTHHALVDGIAGVDLATVLFDAEPVPPQLPARGRAVAPAARAVLARPRRARRPRAGAHAVRAGRPRRVARRAARRETFESTREAIEGVGEIAWAALNPAPATPLNVEIGPHRRFVFLREELEDFKLVKNAFGGTVNDVVLTVVSGGLQKWLRSRGTRTEGLELRALVPVSIRSDEERGSLGNRLARCAGRCRSTSRTRSRGCASCAPRWTGSRSPSRRSAPRCWPACRTSRRRRCWRRPRG